MCRDEKTPRVSTYISDNDTIKKAQSGDDGALHIIVDSNLGLVRSIAKRFIGRGTEYEDLVQIGTLGMIKAVKNFDADKECRFSTYAVPLITGEIKRFLRDDNWIKISRETKKNAQDIFRFSDDFDKKYGREATLTEISEGTGISLEDTVFALESAKPRMSLYEKDEESGFSPENVIGTDEINARINIIALYEVLDKLEKDERVLITLRFFKSLTQSETARFMGIGQVKVSRMEKKILEKMKNMLVPDE